MKIKLILILILLIAVGAGINIKMFGQTSAWKIPKLMTSMRAKEFCSCYFLLGNKKEYCITKVKKGYPLFDFKIDDQDKSVVFSNPIASTKAKVFSPRLGCKLL